MSVYRISRSDVSSSGTEPSHTPTPMGLHSTISSFSFDEEEPYNLVVPSCPSIVGHRSEVRIGQRLQKETAGPPDECSSKDPCSPMESCFVAISAYRGEKFDFRKPTIYTDRHNLSHLIMTFLDGSEVPFKCHVDALGCNRADSGPILVMTRLQTQEPHERWPTFGHSFERETAQYPCGIDEHVTSYRRITEVKFGNSLCVVRAELDGWMQGDKNMESSFEDFEWPVQQELNMESVWCVVPAGDGVELFESGKAVELKTRSSKWIQNLRWRDSYFQMRIGGADLMILGLHDRGTITSIHYLSLDEVRLKAMKNDNRNPENAIHEMAALLDIIRERATKWASEKGTGEVAIEIDYTPCEPRVLSLTLVASSAIYIRPGVKGLLVEDP